MPGILLHIGYRKAGSTFIRDWFNFHPQLKTGGINVNSEFCRYNYYENKPKYFVFSDAFLLFKGDTPPRTIKNLKKYQQDTCTLLKELFPAGKILLITRSPENCITSEYSEYVKNGGIKDFDELQTNPEAMEYFIGYYDYNFAINLYCNAFGKENVIVLPLELLEDTPDIFIKTIEHRLGLEHYDFSYNRRNPSLSANKLSALRKISSLVYQYTRIFGKKGELLYNRYVQYLGKESYNNNKFRLIISVMTLFKKQKKQKIKVPEELTNEMKSTASVLEEYPLFKKYLIKYCLL